MGDDFEVRNITIAHDVLWQELIKWGKRRNLDLVKVMREDDDHLAEWAFIPKLED